jgi:hypothetical protein
MASNFVGPYITSEIKHVVIMPELCEVAQMGPMGLMGVI